MHGEILFSLNLGLESMESSLDGGLIKRSQQSKSITLITTIRALLQGFTILDLKKRSSLKNKRFEIL